MEAHEAGKQEHSDDGDRARRFRFKSRNGDHISRHDEGRTSRHRDHRSHRSKRRKIGHDISRSDRSEFGQTEALGPDAAFRESLFDALGDDEGAAFWQGIYGQPIHHYSRDYVDQETGELEQMNDEEYAQYVRRRMWEKSVEGVEAAKEEHRRKRAEQKRQEEEDIRRARQARPARAEPVEPDFLFDLEVDASLQRGQHRKRIKRWKTIWQDYVKRWDDLQQLTHQQNSLSIEQPQIFLRNKLPWPVESGKRIDVDYETVKEFVSHAGHEIESEPQDEQARTTTLRAERVKWHPDKIQQKYGFMNIDEPTMNGVTAVFQIMDRLWNESKEQPPT